MDYVKINIAIIIEVHREEADSIQKSMQVKCDSLQQV